MQNEPYMRLSEAILVERRIVPVFHIFHVLLQGHVDQGEEFMEALVRCQLTKEQPMAFVVHQVSQRS